MGEADKVELTLAVVLAVADAVLVPLGVGLGLLFLLAATRYLMTGAIRGMRK